MDLTGRPKFNDFELRIGDLFRVTSQDGVHVGEWKLESCRPLPNPTLEALVDADCFILSLTCPQSCPQDLYQLIAADGFTVRLFAVPVARDCMCVTIN